MYIKEVIVVEGKNDTKRLKLFFDCETIETNGLALNKETINYIKEINSKRGVILFLDPDSPGEKIRNKLNEEIPNLKNAFVLKENARTTKKVGVEHASKEILEEALNNLITYTDKYESLTLNEFNELGLSGNINSSGLRNKLSKELHLGKCNAKQMFRRLNMINITKEEIIKYL